MRDFTVLDMLERTALQYADKPAVMMEQESHTYRELLHDAQLLGYGLNREIAGIRKIPMMIFMDKCYEHIAAMLGVLYSGNFYVPIDIKTPIERLDALSEILEYRYVLTTRTYLQTLEQMGYQGNLLLYEDLIAKYEATFDCVEVERNKTNTLDTDLMYIIFTSGSTGVPKGVAVMHRSVMDYIENYVGDVAIEESDIVGNQTPFYADMSLKDIYMALKVGATICIIPQKYFMSPKKLLLYLEEHQVTFIAWVPTAYRIVAQFDALAKVRPSALRKFLFSGEAMPVKVYNYWRSYYDTALYIQQYGPTEITGACTTFKAVRFYLENETIPIGKPFHNTGLMLLDENEQEVTADMVGVPGEICVYGTCLAAGYYNNPEKTNEAFVPNPQSPHYPQKMYRTGDLAKWDADGNLVFISRKDYQVKHGGKRIELGEIESTVLTIGEVKACCCVQNRGKDALVLYYIGAVDGRTITAEVASRLPKYMIPTVYHAMDELPLLPNGKLDRKQMDRWANDGENGRS